MISDSITRYGTISKFLHWLIAITVIGLLVVGFIMINLPKGELRWQIYALHKAIGVSVLLIAAIRIFWRCRNAKPKLPEHHPKWQIIAASSVHGMLYLTTIFMPFSGWIMSVAANHIPSWFGLFQLNLPIEPSKTLAKIAHNTHEILAWVIIACLVLHLAAALKDKNILKRMLPEIKS